MRIIIISRIAGRSGDCLRVNSPRYVYNIARPRPGCKRLYTSLQNYFRRTTGDPPSDLAPVPGTLAPPFRRGVACPLLYRNIITEIFHRVNPTRQINFVKIIFWTSIFSRRDFYVIGFFLPGKLRHRIFFGENPQVKKFFILDAPGNTK